MAHGLQHTFIGCDWGTTGFRLALVRPDGAIPVTHLRTTYVPAGIAETFVRWQQSGNSQRESWFLDELEKAIASIITDNPKSLSEIPVVISGMASSSIGLKELSYAHAPFPLSGKSSITELLKTGSGRQVLMISGVRTEEDVVRGEETQLVGIAQAMGENALRDKTVILPGTHSKHLHINGAGLDRIKTFMTGELFSLLSMQSVLRHSVTATVPPVESVKAIFAEGLEEGFSRHFSAQLFRIRVDQLSGRHSADERSAFLLGLLLGDELKALNVSTAEIILCSGSRQVDHYRFALEKFFPGRHQVVEEQLADQVAFLGQSRIFENYFLN